MAVIPYTAERLRELGYDSKFAGCQTTDPEWVAEIDRVRQSNARSTPRQTTPRFGLSTLAKGCIGLAKVVTGIDAADEDLVKERVKICNGCSHLRMLVGQKQCGLCYCFVEAKARVKSETCPAGLWPGEHPPTIPTAPPADGKCKIC